MAFSLMLWHNAGYYMSNANPINAQVKYPLPTPQDSAKLGLHLKRSLDLLSKSTPEHPQKVKILFYGQSISQSPWTQQLTEELKKRYPYAIIEAKSLAIGAFTAPLLVLNTDRDLLSFYPDLIIFQVYGDPTKYEQIILKMRTLTTADIAIQTEHYNNYNKVLDPNQPDEGWTDFMNNNFLPKVAQRYLCELIDVRSAWRQYLKDNNYPVSQLVNETDQIHLNEQGNWLMAKIVEPYLVGNSFPTPINNPQAKDDWPERVKTYEVGKDIKFKNGKLELDFIGNKIDAIVGKGEDIKAQVFIDNKRPSEIQELYLFTRANEASAKDWPWDVAAPFVITAKTRPQVEEWTLLIEETEVQPVAPGEKRKLNFTFSLTGSKTGADGKGTNRETFISNSGRVIIEPAHWPSSSNNPARIKPGYQLKFKSILLGTDVYQVPEIKDNNHELSVTLAQNLKNEKHHLQLVADKNGTVPIKAIRVYRPPLNAAQIKKPLVSDELTPPPTTNPY